MNGTPNPAGNLGHLVEIQLFGSFNLLINGSEAEKLPKVCRQLFALLVLSGDSGVLRKTAASWLWPDAPDFTARFYLRRTLMQCRDALGDYADFIESYGTDILILSSAVESDFKRFQVLSSSNQPEELMACLDLSRADLVADIESDWLAIQRTKISLFRREIGFRAVRALNLDGKSLQAISLLKDLHSEDPLDDEILILLWTSLFESGEMVELRKSYSEVQARCRRTGAELSDRLTHAALRFFESDGDLGTHSLKTAKSSDHLHDETRLRIREGEAKAVLKALKRNRLVSIKGSPKSGKSELVKRVVDRLGWQTFFASDGLQELAEVVRTRHYLLVVDHQDELNIPSDGTIQSLLHQLHYLKVLQVSRYDSECPGFEVVLGPLSDEDSLKVFQSIVPVPAQQEHEVADLGTIVGGHLHALQILAEESKVFGIGNLRQLLKQRSNPVLRRLQEEIVAPWLAPISEPSKQLLSVLAVLPGSVSLSFVQALGEALNVGAAEEMLAELVDPHRAVKVLPNGRFEVDSLMRLCCPLPKSQFEESLARYFLSAESNRLELDLEDARNMEWLIQSGKIEAKTALDLLNPIGRLLTQSRNYEDLKKLTLQIIGNETLDSKDLYGALMVAGQACHEAHDLISAASLFDQAKHIATKLGHNVWILNALLELGEVVANTGELDYADELLSSARQLARELSDSAQEARAMRSLGYVLRQRGRLEEAIDLTSQALALSNVLGDELGRVWCIGSLASCYYGLNQLDEARAQYMAALSIHRRMDNLPGVAWNLTSLAELCNKCGLYDDAWIHASEALQIQTNLGTHQRAWVLRVLSDTAKHKGDLGQAESLLLDSLNEIRNLGNKSSEALILTRLAHIAVDRRDWNVGRVYLDLAKQINGWLTNSSIQRSIEELEGLTDAPASFRDTQSVVS